MSVKEYLGTARAGIYLF